MPVSPEPVTVLYIEDNRVNALLVQRALTVHSTFQLIVAESGGAGLAAAHEHRPCVILLDLHLPDMSGEAVLQQLRAAPETKATPVLVVTADAAASVQERLLTLGATAFLTKPLDLRGLIRTITEVAA
ncbi:MAG: response regulator [Dehalococcoidia bacterium]|nr:response regulator [Dehalococcoidia bacterium]